MKNDKGVYAIKGKTYKILEGSRAQVYHNTAYKTAGGLTKKDLHMNKNGRIVSMKKHKTAKKEKRLEAAGYFAKKGKFGFVKKTLAKKIQKKSNNKKTKKNKGKKGKKR